jgi:hypothetical protein
MDIKIYIKNAPTCFVLITIVRERAICFSNSNFSKAQIVRSLMIVIKPKNVGAFLM